MVPSEPQVLLPSWASLPLLKKKRIKVVFYKCVTIKMSKFQAGIVIVIFIFYPDFKIN